MQMVFPQVKVQLCIVHLLRNSLKHVSWKDCKAVAQGLAAVYRAPSEQAALAALEQFAQDWNSRYSLISKQWHQRWLYIATLFSYPQDIRRAIYTTNAIESLNSVLRTAVLKRRVFPSDRSALKVLYLAAERASRKWTLPIRDWKAALNHFAIEFGDRIVKFL